MSLTDQQAYAALKQLENNGRLHLPAQPVATVNLGTWTLGTPDSFAWAKSASLSTIPSHDTPSPPIEVDPVAGQGPIQKPHVPPRFPPSPPLDPRAGLVIVNAENLTLQFEANGATSSVKVLWNGLPHTATSTPSGPRQSTISVALGAISEGVPEVGFLTVESGTHKRRLQIGIARMPGVTAGAFTIPVVPTVLVYAPPPGSIGKDNAEYESAVTMSRKVETTVGQASSSKQATAYTTNDFITKIAGLAKDADSLANMLASAVSSAVSGASGSGGTSSGDSSGGSPVDTLLSSVSDVLTALIPDSTGSQSSQLTVSDDNTMETTFESSVKYTAGPPGPGEGDMFVYIRNVRLAWLIGDGGLSFTVLGNDGERQFPASDLLSDQAAVRGGAAVGPTTNLDSASIEFLLSLDPFVGTTVPTLSPPRFVRNDPTSDGGDAGTGGATRQEIHQITTSDLNSQESVTTTITDYKPGWLDALFGSNQSTEDQITLTYKTSQEATQIETQTVTVNVYGQFGFSLWFDTLFGTLAFTQLEPSALIRPLGEQVHVGPVA
jgi:hypothetical protein